MSFDRPPLVINEPSVAASGWPTVPPQFVPRWFEPVDALAAGVTIGLAELGQSCHMHCQSHNARCTDTAMQKVRPMPHGVVVFVERNRPPLPPPSRLCVCPCIALD